MRIVNINNNLNIINNNQRISTKTLIDLIIHIIIIIPVLSLFYFLTKSKFNSFNALKHHSDILISNRTNTNNTNLNHRYLTTVLQGEYNKAETPKKIQYQDIVNKLSKKIYYGKWFTNTTVNGKKLIIGEAFSGLTKLQFSKAYHTITKEDALAIIIDNYENNYINHWYHHSSYIFSKFLELIPDKVNNKFILKGRWETHLEYGEFFETKISQRYPCVSNFSFVFPMKNSSYSVKTSEEDNYIVNFNTIDESNFEAKLKSLCAYNRSMEMIMQMSCDEDGNKYFNKKKEKKEVFNYFIIVTIICVFNCIINNIMVKDLNNNKEAAACFPIFYLGFNINWHIYCCLTHLRWSFAFKEYYYEFNSIGLLYIIDIIFHDIRLSCQVWSLIKSYNTNRVFVQKRMLYYFSFYILSFITIFINPDLFFFNHWIVIITFLTWTPQIIYNAIYNNKYIYPIIHIINTSFDKLFFGFYFTGYKYNFFRIKEDKYFMFGMVCYVIINLIVLYLQYKMGPRFFLPKECQKMEFDFYKNKKELMELIKDVDKVECVICLMPIFYDENNINEINKEENSNNNNKQINIDNSISTINNDVSLEGINNFKETNNGINNINIINQNTIKKKPRFKFKYKNKIDFCKNIINCFEAFYKFKKAKKNINKKYMSTPCHHVFHKECLEKWLLLKRECPNCRDDLSNIL